MPDTRKPNFDDLKRARDEAMAAGPGTGRWIKCAQLLMDSLPAIYDTAKAMNEDAARLREDAARYRWLRANRFSEDEDGGLTLRFECAGRSARSHPLPRRPHWLDVDIDSERGAETTDYDGCPECEGTGRTYPLSPRQPGWQEAAHDCAACGGTGVAGTTGEQHG